MVTFTENPFKISQHFPRLNCFEGFIFSYKILSKIPCFQKEMLH